MSTRCIVSIGVLALLAVSLLSGCAPAASPVTPTPSVPKSTATSTLQTPIPQVSPEDAGWQQTIRLAQKEGRLVVYDTGSNFAADAGRAVAAAFKNKYGITVEFLITGGSSNTLEKLKVEKKMGQAVADAVAAGSISSQSMIELGLVKDVSHELPVLKDKSVFIMDPIYSPGGEALSFTDVRLPPAFNSNLVKPGELQSYNDLLNPKWKGKITMRDPRLGSGGEPLVITTLRYTKTLGDDYFYQLAKQSPALLAISANEVAQIVARGDYSIYGLGGGIESQFASIISEGAPLTVAAMKEGTVAQTSVIMVVANAPHPNAAKLFANWLLSLEGQKVEAEAKAIASFRKDVPDFSPAQIASVKFDKIIPFTWEIATQVNADVKAGVMDKFFGKR